MFRANRFRSHFPENESPPGDKKRWRGNGEAGSDKNVVDWGPGVADQTRRPDPHLPCGARRTVKLLLLSTTTYTTTGTWRPHFFTPQLWGIWDRSTDIRKEPSLSLPARFLPSLFGSWDAAAAAADTVDPRFFTRGDLADVQSSGIFARAQERERDEWLIREWMDQGRGLLPSFNLSKEERKDGKSKSNSNIGRPILHFVAALFRPLLRSSSFSEALPPHRRSRLQTPVEARRFIHYSTGLNIDFLAGVAWIPLATGNGFTQFRRGTKSTLHTQTESRHEDSSLFCRASHPDPFVLRQATQPSKKIQNGSSQFMTEVMEI